MKFPNASSKNSHRSKSTLEPLESRIAPAGLGILRVVGAVTGSPLELHAGDMLSTSALGGSYLLFVEKGSAVIYTTDLNNNNQVDFNEITGISAGDGLRLISFVDIHGDIVTNLKADGHTLTDSDNNATNGLDGRVLLDSKIEKIELRSLTQADLPAGQDVNDRLALSTYSIYGNIYAGGGFGATDGGLIFDVAGKALQATKFDGATGISLFVDVPPQIGSIKVGTAASGENFSFGTTLAGFGLGFNGEDVAGTLQTFRPHSGEIGADITGVRMVGDTAPFNLGTLQAGDGGFNGRGGNISNILLTGDFAGGYKLIAGNGGSGNVGQSGGSIINFLDHGSITSEVVLQSGNGGEGLLGAGGNGGNIVLLPGTTINVAGRLIMNLGDGGAGLTAGGAGGSQKNGVITSPEGVVPSGLSLVSSTHSPGDIYNTEGDGSHFIRGFDFDGDGYNDVVYTSQNPDQLVVLFGSANGFDEQGTRYPGAPGTIYLNTPANAEAIVVADLNGDGHPDIAAASQDGSSAGVSVFLSNYALNPVTNVPTFVGFHDPSYQALPHLAEVGYFQKALPITAITAGDYNGDGIVDLAINTVQTDLVTKTDNNVVMVLRGDDVSGVATGHFFADFKSGTPVSIVSNNADPVVLKSSALADGGQDFFFGGVVGGRSVILYNNTTGSLTATPLGLGQVDTNREVSDPLKRDQIQLQDATLRDFTILDLNNDGSADIVVLAGNPAGFLVTFQGNGTPGGFTKASNDPSDDTFGRTDENTGIDIGENAPEGLGVGGLLVGILTTAAQGDGKANDISLVAYRSNPDAVQFVNLSFTNFFTATNAGGEPGTGLLAGADPNVLAFDTLRPVEAITAAKSGFSFISPTHDSLEDLVLRTPSAILDLVSIANNGYFLKAGDGGDSAIGRGGAGGQLGDQILGVNGQPLGTVSIVVPDNPAFEPTARFIGGHGGTGYLGGGKGGDVRGLTLTEATAGNPFNVVALLFAGDGGDSVKGAGGAGGNLSSLSILGGEVFNGGDGGRGLVGGAGGSIIGNKVPNLPDTTNTQTVSLAVQGGHGGLGLKAGGAGGSVVNFTPDIRPVLGEDSTVLFYLGGAGGNSLSGTAGAGGSVTNSSPVSSGNNLVSDIHLEGGRGGNGLTGGAGGSITDFINSPGQGSLPHSVNVLAGYGGIGTARNGGAGGSIRNVNISARGVGFDWLLDFSQPETIEAFPGIPAIPVNFGRYIAGEGAISYGGSGGAGGSLSAVTGVATSASFAVAAGKGGNGLRAGGAGGSITTATVNAAATLGKVLAIAGDGGDVYSSIATGLDPLAFGGVNGPGGNGGAINGFKQDASQSTIVDLIAGNGGSTINHGSSLDLTTNAGRGGSISNVNVAGDIGDVNVNSAIVAYNDINSGEIIADFVQNTLLGTPGADLRAAGNVGIVVGATGRVRDNNGDGQLDPASVGINGSLSSVLASNIMSAVAGSVDRIASIQLLTDVRVRTEGAIFGADKAMPAPATFGTRDYLDANGLLVTTPELGGELLDGAIIAKNDRPLQSIRDFIRR